MVKGIPEEKNERVRVARRAPRLGDSNSLFPFDCICMHHTYTP